MKSFLRMKATPLLFLITFLFMGLLTGCDSKKEELGFAAAPDYLIALQPGKYLTYRLDSMVFTQAGRQEELHSYQEKHVVDAEINDALGRTGYRVFRFLNNVNGTGTWQPAGSYFMIPTAGTVEMVEDNLRVVTLTGPVKQGHSWKGNRFLATDPYSANYTFSVDDDMPNWDFIIEETDGTITLNGKTYSNVITITHADESENVPITDIRTYASKVYSVDKYAKGLGLIYQEHILWEHQPNPNGTAYKTGFGIKRSLIDHN